MMGYALLLNDEYQSRLKRIGPPSDSIAASESAVAFLRLHLPEPHADLVEVHGFCGFFQNGYQLCDPQIYCTLAENIFRDDNELVHKECHIAGFSAWGDLYFWSERYGLGSINLLQYQIRCMALAKSELGGPPLPTLQSKPDEATAKMRLGLQLLPREEEIRECWDWQNEPLFDKAVTANGALELGECFGFAPSLGISGYNSRNRAIENVKKFFALPHFSMIAQVKEFDLVRTVKGRSEVVRRIG